VVRAVRCFIFIFLSLFAVFPAFSQVNEIGTKKNEGETKAAYFPLSLLMREAAKGPVWVPDWAPELPVDAFYAAGSGRGLYVKAGDAA
jgi:hypothetical protein